jgi:uncharacterized protein (DUF58 family)
LPALWSTLYYYVFVADYLSWVNRYLPWRHALGCLLMAAAATAVCAWFLHEQAMVLLICILLALALGLAWPGLSALGYAAELRFDQQQVREGQPVQVRLRIRNAWPLGLWGLRLRGGFERCLPAERGDGYASSLAMVPGWRITDFTWVFVPLCRGEYPESVPRLVTGFPFGLWEAGRRVQVASKLIVWPRTFPLHLLPEAAANDRTREGLTPVDRVGNSGDFMGVRPYRRGDSLRRVHWAQSARHDRLIVCEQQTTACPRLQVILDLDPVVHAGTGPESSREWAVRIAASIAESALRQASLVEVLLPDGVIPLGGGPAHTKRLLDALARIPDLAKAPMVDLLSTHACKAAQGGLQVVVTTANSLASLPESMQRQRGRHFVVLDQERFHTSLGSPQGGGCPDREGERPAAAGRRDRGRLIWINRPAAVEEEMRAGWKELLCAN